MDELLPVLIARVAHRDDAMPVIEAALRQGIAFLSIEEPPSYEGPHALEVHVPDWTEPVLLMAEPAGDPLGAEYPLAVRPFAPEHVEALQALLAEAGITFEMPPPAPAHAVVDEPPLVDLRLSDPPPVGARPSEAPHGAYPSGAPGQSALHDAGAPETMMGRVLGGKYSIEQLLGSGGMGAVYQGTHLALRKAIAVKVLHPSHLHNEEFLEAFHREALAASRLDHPNVVQVMDYGHEEDGVLYIVMELLAGTDLRAVLDKQAVHPLARIVDVMTQVAAALSASHDQNVIHRDIKPENIILVPKRDDDGTVRDVVKVCDFGIAEIVERKAVTPGTRAHEVSGTPDYMSPEQVHGGAIDARADIYACGVILYEMATGKVPFFAEETPEEIAMAHVHKEPPAPSSLHPGLDRRFESLILKAMAKDPARRHQTARELRAELRALAAMESQSRRLDSFTEEDDAIPIGIGPQFERNDAIDIGDLFAIDPVAPSKPGAVKEQIWVLSEQMATALIQDPGAVLAKLEALEDQADYAREMSTLERAMASAATRVASQALLVTVTHLAAHARGAEPGGRTREAIAARALAAIAKPELLLRVADDALDGAPAARDPARKLLVALGGAGAHALAAARDRACSLGAGWAGRPRFVAAMREIGALAVPALVSFLEQARDSALLEDLMRAVPDPPQRSTPSGPPSSPAPASARPDPVSMGGDPPARSIQPATERLGALLSTVHIRHEAPAVRRAAAQALSSVWGARANAWLAPLLEDPDDGLRIAAIGALRRHGGIDREVVRRIDRILSGAAHAGSEARVAAAAALVDAAGPARPEAAQALAQALRPATSGFFSKLVTAEGDVNPLVITTMARALLAIGGPDAAKVIEARAGKSSADLKRQLMDVLAGRAR